MKRKEAPKWKPLFCIMEHELEQACPDTRHELGKQ